MKTIVDGTKARHGYIQTQKLLTVFVRSKEVASKITNIFWAASMSRWIMPNSIRSKNCPQSGLLIKPYGKRDCKPESQKSTETADRSIYCTRFSQSGIQDMCTNQPTSLVKNILLDSVSRLTFFRPAIMRRLSQHLKTSGGVRFHSKARRQVLLTAYFSPRRRKQ